MAGFDHYTLEDLAIEVCGPCSGYTEPMLLCFDPNCTDPCGGCVDLISKEEFLDMADDCYIASAVATVLEDTCQVEVALTYGGQGDCPGLLTITQDLPATVCDNTVTEITTSIAGDVITVSYTLEDGTVINQTIAIDDCCPTVSVNGIAITPTTVGGQPNYDIPIVGGDNTTVTTAADGTVTIDTCCASVEVNGVPVTPDLTNPNNPIYDVIIPDSPANVVTTDGNSTGVTQSGTLDHTIDITVTSTDTDNILTIGSDGGTYLDCDTVCECIIGDLTECEGGSPSDFCAQVADCIDLGTDELVEVVNADGTRTYTHTAVDGTVQPFCIGALLEDEDGRTSNLDCDPCLVHRSIHLTGSLHTGSVGGDCIMSSHSDSDQVAVNGVTTNHDKTVISALNATSTGVRTLTGGANNVNAGANSWVTGGGNLNAATGGNNFIVGTGNIVEGDWNNTSGATNVIGVDSRGNQVTGNVNSLLGDSDYNNVSGTNNVLTDTLESQVSGDSNVVTGAHHTVAGNENDVRNVNNTVSGARNLVITGGNLVSGGDNVVNGGGSSVVSGNSNTELPLSLNSLITGGNNTTDLKFATITAGFGNTIQSGAPGNAAHASMIAAGHDNLIGGSSDSIILASEGVVLNNGGVANQGLYNSMISTSGTANITGQQFIGASVISSNNIAAVRNRQLHTDNLYVDYVGHGRIFADNAAALAGGLVQNEHYRTPAGVVMAVL